MKRFKVLMLSLGLALMLTPGIVWSHDDVGTDGNSIEMASALHSSQVELQSIEQLKITDAEFINYVATKSSFGGGSYILGFSLLILFASMFRSVRQFLKTNRWMVGGTVTAIALVIIYTGSAEAGTGILMAETVVGFTDPQQKELEKLFNAAGEKHKSVVSTEIQEAIKGLITADQFGERMKGAGLEPGKIEELQEAIEKQGLQLKTYLESKPKVEKSFAEIINDASADIKKLATGEARQAKIVIPGAVAKDLVLRSAVADSTQAMRLPGIGQIGYLGAVMTNIFRHAPVSPDSNGVIRYMDQETVTRNADVKAEGAAAPESVIDWIEKSLDITKIMDSIPVSMESFRDVLFIKSEVERLLNVNLSLKEDQQLFGGSGAANQLKGVYTSAGAFASGTLSGTVDQANVYDLIAAIKVTIMNGKQSKYNPDFVLLNPLDVFKYKVLKGTDGHYLLPPFVAADGSVIAAMRVYESSQVTANTLVVGDSRFGTIYDMGGIEVEMGFVDDQFSKDTMTIKARKRTALLIRDVDVTGFNKVADVAAAVADLETA